MNKYVVIGVIVLSVFIILFGRYQYGQKLSDIASNARETLAEINTDVEDVNDDGAGNPPGDDEPPPEDNNEGEGNSQTVDLINALPEDLNDIVAARYEAGETVSILAFGSEALTDSRDEGLTPWPELLEEGLNESYGTDLFEVETISAGGMTSLAMVQEGLHEEVAESGADIFIVEPLLWNDNGEVSIEHSTEHLTMLISAITDENDNAAVMLNPSQPAYNTVNYPIQVEGLRAFANENDYLFVDHWDDWPDGTNEDLLDYVGEEEDRMPTQLGHEQWSDSLLSVFAN